MDLVTCNAPDCSWAIICISYRGLLFPHQYGGCGE